MKKLPMEVTAHFIPECEIPLIFTATCYELDPIFSWDSLDLKDFDLYDSYVEICDVSKDSIYLKLRSIKPCESTEEIKKHESGKDSEDSDGEWVKIYFDKRNLLWYLVEDVPEGVKITRQSMRNHNIDRVPCQEYQINRGSRSEKLAMALSMRKSKPAIK